MSKTDDQHDSDNLLNNKGKLDRSDSWQKDSKTTEGSLVAPSIRELSIVQWVIIGILYTFLALLVVFIIYISATWNKDRTNEYT